MSNTDTEPDAKSSLEDSPQRDPQSPDGSAYGYRPARTLPLRVELRRQASRRRTVLTLLFLAVLPILLLVAFQSGGHVGGRASSRNLADIATSSGLNFTVFTLYAATDFLLVVVVALFFGDTVSGEASWSSLKYLLAAPIPRSRLLRQKALVAAALSVVALALLAAVALAAGTYWYGRGDLLTPTGESLPLVSGVLRLAVAVGYMAVQLSWIAGLALWWSVSTDAPLGAVGGAVLVSILSQILDQITALGDLRTYLPTHYALSWTDLLTSDIDWTSLANGAFSALAYATAFIVLAVLRFRTKDITT